MVRVRLAFQISDRIAATNPDIVRACQELVYFFFVVFVVDFHLFPDSRVPYCIGVALMLLAFTGFLYYTVPYFLARATRLLPPDQKTELVIAHRAGSRDHMQAILSTELELRSADRIVEVLGRRSEEHLKKLMGL